MQKTVSLIIAMFLLLSSCGKIRELMNPTSDTSAQAKAAAEAQAKAAAEAQAKAAAEAQAKAAAEAQAKAAAEAQAKAAAEAQAKAAAEAQAKAAAEAQAKAAAEAQAKAAIEPEIKTPSESETEEQEEENEEDLIVESSLSSRVALWTATKAIQAAAISAIVYVGYKSIRHAIGEENWNSIMKTLRLRGGQQLLDNKTKQQMDKDDNIAYIDEDFIDYDEYSEGGRGAPTLRKFKGEGIDYSILNEKMLLDAKLRGDMPPVLFSNVLPKKEGNPTRLVSKTGRLLKIGHEDQYKVHWKAYKERNYPRIEI